MSSPVGNIEKSAKRVLVFGASGDIGSAVASGLLAAGYSLGLTRSPTSAGSSSLPSLESEGSQWFTLDARNSNSVAEAVKTFEDEGPIYALVYCIGIVRDMPLLLMPDEVWDQVIGTNLTGAFYAIRSVSRGMMVANAGRIVLVGSVASHKPGLGQSAYCSAKAGLEGLCRAASRELGRYGITCNVVAPGAIESRMFRNVARGVVDKLLSSTSIKRPGTPEDVAGCVEYLLSPTASYITGQTMVIDGGII